MTRGLAAVIKALNKIGLTGIHAMELRKSVVLRGTVKTLDEKIKAGYAAVKKGYKGVINDIEVEGFTESEISKPYIEDKHIDGKHFDAVVIGGGIIGASILRELTRYNISTALFEKEEDLAKHTSSRNDGMIHPGFAATPGSKKAYYNIRGNKAYTRITEELKVPFHRPGSILLFRNPLTKLLLPFFYSRARANGAEGCRYISNGEIRKMIPDIFDNIHGGFYMPGAGQLSPHYLTLAYAENAVQNGARIFFNTIVTGMIMDGSRISGLETNRGVVSAGVVINAAGVWADKIAGYANDRFFSLHFRKGTEAILDKNTVKYLKHMVGMPPIIQVKSKSKGGGLVATVEGNILVGPTAVEQPYRERYTTEEGEIKELKKHINLIGKINASDIITYFSGIRACTYEEDFIVEPSEYVENLVHAAGIQSPGLASAPAISEDVSRMCIKILKMRTRVDVKRDFNPERIVPPALNGISEKERAEWIKINPAYGRIVCRCEEISEGEIRDALRSPVPASTVDGIKRRTRACSGRCHGGFCTPRIMEIMADELKVDMTRITKKGYGSEILLRQTKDNVDYSGFSLKTDDSGAVT